MCVDLEGRERKVSSIISLTSMSQSNDIDAVLTDMERFEGVLDYEEEGPHIRLLTPDNWLIIISIRTLSDAS